MNSALASGLHIHPHCVYQGKVNCTHSLFTRKISPFRWHGPKVGSLKPLPAAAGKRQSQDVSSHIGLGWTCSCCVGLGASSGLWGTLLEGTWAGLRRASSKGRRYMGIHKDSLNGIISVTNVWTTPGLSGLYRNMITANYDTDFTASLSQHNSKATPSYYQGASVLLITLQRVWRALDFFPVYPPFLSCAF